MAYPNSDCVCVQGIEAFLDPRLTMPQEEGYDHSTIDLPVWEKNFEHAVQLRQEKEAEISKEKESEPISPERIIQLVVQKTNLINQGYSKLTAYQINSMYVQVNSIDTAWINANVSLIFSHQCLEQSITVPIIELGTPVTIPAELLIPGTLKIVAIAVKKVGDYSVITTNALQFQIYDPGFKPIHWPKIKDYDVYFYYQTLAKQLLAEVKEIKENTPIKIQGIIHAGIKNETDADAPVKYIPVKYTAVYDKYSIEYNVNDFILTDLDLKSAYTISLTLPSETLGVTNISEEEYIEKRDELGSYVYVDDIMLNDLSTIPVPIEKLDINYSNLPEIVVKIPRDLEVTTLKVAIRDLEFDRELVEESK